MDPASASSVAARARTENFPVASLLFPRSMRPHLRAVYGFARLVDMLGDELEGDRLAALDELEAEVDACYEGEPTWEVTRALQPTIRACGLPREPFLRLIEANRMDQRVSEYETWADLKHYCVHSADPVGRLVLGVIGRPEPALVALSDDVCTGLQLVNFLQDVPRDLDARARLPARRGPPALRRHRAGQAERSRCGACWSSRPSAPAGCSPTRARSSGGGSAAASAGRSRSSGAGESRRSRRSSAPTGTSSTGGRGPRGRGWRWRRFDDRRGRLRGGRAAHAPRGPQLRLRDHGSAAAEATGDRGDLRVRAPRRRRGRRRAAARREADAAPRVARRPGRASRRGRDARGAGRRALALPDPRAMRCTSSWTAVFRTPSRAGTRTSTSCSATAAGSRAPSALPASRCTARTRSGTRRRSASRSS